MENNEDNTYLIFHLGNELYGTPLLDVVEVIEPQNLKEVPNSVSHFEGVMNLRGQIIGVLDFRKKLQIKETDAVRKKAFVVFNSPIGLMATVVDSVDMVLSLDSENIEFEPKVSTTVPTEFLLGIAKTNIGLTNLVKFTQMLDKEDLKEYRSSKLAA